MKLYFSLMFMLLSMRCFGQDEITYFIYKKDIFKITGDRVATINTLPFCKRTSTLEFAYLEGFMVVRIGPNSYRLIDIPFKDRRHLLQEEEQKVLDDLKNI